MSPTPRRKDIEETLKEFNIKADPFMVNKLVALNMQSYFEGQLSKTNQEEK
jgi:hypothetical protein